MITYPGKLNISKKDEYSAALSIIRAEILRTHSEMDLQQMEEYISKTQHNIKLNTDVPLLARAVSLLRDGSDENRQMLGSLVKDYEVSISTIMESIPKLGSTTIGPEEHAPKPGKHVLVLDAQELLPYKFQHGKCSEEQYEERVVNFTSGETPTLGLPFHPDFGGTEITLLELAKYFGMEVYTIATGATLDALGVWHTTNPNTMHLDTGLEVADSTDAK